MLPCKLIYFPPKKKTENGKSVENAQNLSFRLIKYSFISKDNSFYASRTSRNWYNIVQYIIFNDILNTQFLLKFYLVIDCTLKCLMGMEPIYWEKEIRILDKFDFLSRVDCQAAAEREQTFLRVCWDFWNYRNCIMVILCNAFFGATPALILLLKISFSISRRMQARSQKLVKSFIDVRGRGTTRTLSSTAGQTTLPLRYLSTTITGQVMCIFSIVLPFFFNMQIDLYF